MSGNKITDKQVQVHERWTDGYNEVYTDSIRVRWADLAKAGISRRRDKSTGKPFLLRIVLHSIPFYGPGPDDYIDY
jgi:hypothetical protein